ncbi:LexA family protein [Fannyhessea vaginae]|uniref:LexA family protein n=1 Tax=Fannyhessea vaginae TaxID=82135 RepID=UPI003A80B060
MSIRQNIIKLREQQNITQEELAKIAGVSRGAVSQWEGGFSEPRMGAIQKIADHFHILKSNLIEDNGMDNTSQSSLHKLTAIGSTATLPLRTLGKVHAGVMDDDDVCDDEEIQVPERVVLAYPDAFLLRVEGNCMDRVIPEGSHVVVVPHKVPTNGSIVVIRDDTYEAIMRRYYKGSSALMLSPDSYEEEYQDIIVHDGQEITLIGVVVWWQASEMME